MKDLIITINADNRKVRFNRDFIGLNGENLQGNIVVDFEDKADFVDGTASFEVEQNGEKYSIGLTKNATNKAYSVPIKSSLLRYACTMKCQVSITQAETDEGIPVFKSDIFNLPCREAIIGGEEIPEQYPSWCDQVDAKLADLERRVENVDGTGINVDSYLSNTSTNPVQNKVVKNALDSKVDREGGKGLSSNDYTATDKAKVNKIITNGDGKSYLANDGTYKAVQGGGETYDDTQLRALINNKVDKVNGKGLSSNDYTATDKAKVNLIKTNAGANSFLAGDGTYKEFQVSENSSITVDHSLNKESNNPIANSAVATAFDSKVDKVDGKGLSTNDFTDDEKTKLASIDLGANSVIIDGELDEFSTNPVQNKVIKSELDNKQDKLTAGSGINIDSNNKISAELIVNSSEYNGTATLLNDTLILNDEPVEAYLKDYVTNKELTDKLKYKANTSELNTKQDKLVDNKNIKTINGTSLLGSGDIEIKVSETYDDTEIRDLINNKVDKVDGKGLSTNDYTNEEKQKLDAKQDELISGQNIKTINGTSLLGKGNIVIQGGSGAGYDDTEIRNALNNKQDKLTAGTGINIDSNNKISAELEINSSDYNGSATVANEVLILNDEASGNVGINIENGTGKGSVKYGENNNANGEYTLAGGKGNTAYQSRSISLGGNCQSGMNEEEFNNYYGVHIEVPGVGDNHGVWEKCYVPRVLWENDAKVWELTKYTSADNNGRRLQYTEYSSNTTITFYVFWKHEGNAKVTFANSVDNYSTNFYDPNIYDDSHRTYEKSTSIAISMGADCKSYAKYSASFNSENKVYAKAGTLFGTGNVLEKTAENGLGGGRNNKTSGFNDVTFGGNNTNDATSTLMGGEDSIATQGVKNAFLWGKGLQTQIQNIIASEIKAILGQYNTVTNEDVLFIFGNGKDENNRSNAFEILKDGRAKVYGNPKDKTDVVRLGDIKNLITVENNILKINL